MSLRVFCVLLLCLAACGGAPTNNTDTANTPNFDAGANAEPIVQQDLPTTDDGQPIAARVNGEPIELARFERELTRRSAVAAQAADDAALRLSVLDTLIEQKLIEQAAAAEGVSIDPTVVDNEVSGMVTEVGGDDSWQSWLSQNNYTTEEFRSALESTLITAAMRDVVTRDLFEEVPQVHARHILVGSEGEALAVLQRLEAGEGFTPLAAEISLDVTTKDQGGDLGWFTRDELLEPRLAEVAFGLQPGEMAGPVPTRLGYHIIQTLAFDTLPLSDEERAAVAQVQFEEWLQTLLATATVERFI